MTSAPSVDSALDLDQVKFESSTSSDLGYAFPMAVEGLGRLGWGVRLGGGEGEGIDKVGFGSPSSLPPSAISSLVWKLPLVRAFPAPTWLASKKLAQVAV